MPEQDGAYADGEGNARPPENAREDIAPEIVRAEHEGAVRRVEAHMDVLSQRVEGGKLWREHRHKQHT